VQLNRAAESSFDNPQRPFANGEAAPGYVVLMVLNGVRLLRKRAACEHAM
jgi:hypothetical protein